jgi:hypothetical protein
MAQHFQVVTIHAPACVVNRETRGWQINDIYYNLIVVPAKRELSENDILSCLFSARSQWSELFPGRATRRVHDDQTAIVHWHDSSLSVSAVYNVFKFEGTRLPVFHSILIVCSEAQRVRVLTILTARPFLPFHCSRSSRWTGTIMISRHPASEMCLIYMAQCSYKFNVCPL